MNDKKHDTILHEGRFLRLVVREGWEYVERPNISGIVVIAAVTEQRELVLVEQYRPPVAARTIELPAGLAGDIPGTETEDLAEAARRELLEETGYEAPRMDRLTEYPSSAGLTSEILTLYHAPGVRRVGPGGGDHNEDIETHVVPLAEVDAWLAAQERAGRMIDPKVYAGLYFIERLGP